MVTQTTLLVIMVKLVDSIPMPPRPVSRSRGRPKVYAERLFLKALVIMLIRQVQSVNGLLSILGQPTGEMQHLRHLLTDEKGRFPSRRTWERRLAAVPTVTPRAILIGSASAR